MNRLLENKLEIFHNIYFDVLLGLAVVVIFSLILLLSLLRIARNINQTNAKVIDLIDDIRTMPLFDKIYHISFIAENNSVLQIPFMRWRTIFEITYEKKFRQIVEKAYDFAQDKKNMRPRKANLTKILKIYDELGNNVYQVGLTIIDDINNFLEPERIYRDYYVKMDHIYLALSSYLDKQIAIDAINIKPNSDPRKNISGEFSDFYDTLRCGYWNELKEKADNMANLISHLIKLIDTIPQLKLECEKIINSRLSSLKDRYVMFNKNKEDISLRTHKFKELELEVDEKRRVLKRQIENVQYIKGRTTLNEINRLLAKYESFASYETGIQAKLNNFSDDVTDIIYNATQSSAILLKKAEETVDYKNPQFDFYDLQHWNNELSKIEAKWTITRERIEAKSGKPVAFDKLRDEVINIIEKFNDIMNHILKFEDLVNKSVTETSKLIDQLVIAEAIVSQIDVKIAQYHGVKSLKLSQPKVDELHRELQEEIRGKINASLTNAEMKGLEAQLTEIYQKANELSRSVILEIFNDFVTQELIIYMSRFPDDNEGYERFIASAIEKRSNGKYTEVINDVVAIINQLKAKEKSRA
jgi:hypothetical protein